MRRTAHWGAEPPGGRGAARPTPGSAIGAAGTALGVQLGPLWGPDKWVRPKAEGVALGMPGGSAVGAGEARSA